MYFVYKLFDKFKDNKKVNKALKLIRASTFATILVTCNTVIKNTVLTDSNHINYKVILLAIIIYLCMKKIKLHPVIYMAVSGVIGIVFSFSMEMRYMKKLLSLMKLFYLFSIMGIHMFGNFITIIPIFENELVIKRKMITNEDIVDAITMGRCGPGATIVNTIAFLGNRIDGFLGGVFATLGFCFFPFLVILIISFSIDTFLNNEIIKHFLKGVSTCISVMIFNSMIDLGKKTLRSKICVFVFIVTLMLSITTNIPIVCYLIFCVILSIFLKIDF